MPPPGSGLQLAPASTAPRREGPSCYQCRHFAVSWDPRLPYLCRLMGFKSRQLPAIEVLRADGVPCQGYSPKSDAPPSARPVAGSAGSSPMGGCVLQLSGRAALAAEGTDLPDLRPGWAGRRTP